MIRACLRVAIAAQRCLTVPVSRCVAWVAAHGDDLLADLRVTSLRPEADCPLRLSIAEPLLPARILGQATKGITDRRGMLLLIEVVAVGFRVMKPNMVRRCHAREIRGQVVASIEVDVVAMGPCSICIHAMAQIPLVSESMCRHEMAIQRLVNLLITPDQLPIERHQRLTRAQSRGQAASTRRAARIRDPAWRGSLRRCRARSP